MSPLNDHAAVKALKIWKATPEFQSLMNGQTDDMEHRLFVAYLAGWKDCADAACNSVEEMAKEPKKRKVIEVGWTCSQHVKHYHKHRWLAWLCGLFQRLRGRWRLAWGFCPGCNCDAPEMDECVICGGYDPGRKDPYPVPESVLNAWYSRFFGHARRYLWRDRDYFYRLYFGWMPMQKCMVCDKWYWGGLPRWWRVNGVWQCTWQAVWMDYCSTECMERDDYGF